MLLATILDAHLWHFHHWYNSESIVGPADSREKFGTDPTPKKKINDGYEHQWTHIGVHGN